MKSSSVLIIILLHECKHVIMHIGRVRHKVESSSPSFKEVCIVNRVNKATIVICVITIVILAITIVLEVF